ncbi:MAG: beta-galactosidase [Patescibacteria group bacterium]
MDERNARLRTGGPGLIFGVDYYPEHWPEERWPVDAGLMRQAGLRVARVGEFAWSRFEPREGEYDFAWLDRAIEVLAAEGIGVVIGTPTAAPPAWLAGGHPEILPVNRHGMRIHFGGRQHFCPRNPTYRRYARAITTALANHYKSCPAVIGWQVDNEYRGRCYCPVCAAEFRAWLQRRYGSLARLNEAWGTVFWSQEYGRWDEIPLPLGNVEVNDEGAASSDVEMQNPSLRLDFSRFSSDSYVDFTREQTEIIREIAGARCITHNVNRMLWHEIDFYALAGAIDVLTLNQYPLRHEGPPDPRQNSLYLDVARGAGGGTFWVVEQQSGPTGWGTIGARPEPGQVRLWTYQSLARGADGILYFRWRSCRFGTEEFWHGILEHDGIPRRCHREVAQIGRELAKVGERIAGTAVRAKAALVMSFPSRWAFTIQPNNRGFRYDRHFRLYYDFFWQSGIPVDIVPPTAPLDGYRLVVAPALYVLGGEAAENLRRYAENGGNLVLTMRTGVKDESNVVVDRALPGLLAETAGVSVEEYDSLLPGTEVRVRLSRPGPGGHGGEFAVPVWCENLAPARAEVEAVYCGGIYDGRPAVTLARGGAGGLVMYVGVYPGPDLAQVLLARMADACGLGRAGGVDTRGSSWVETSVRTGGDGRELVFLLNHGQEPVQVGVEGNPVDLLTGLRAGPGLTLPPYGVGLLERDLPALSPV